MATYTVQTGDSQISVTAKSSIHDTDTRWNRLTGSVEANPDTLVESGATAEFSLDMTAFDAGDWLKNRKLKKDFDLASHPTAKFTLDELRNVVRRDDGTFAATAVGTLRWRGREVTLEIAGEGSVTKNEIRARGRFELDITKLGLKAPRVLMFKVEDVVAVQAVVRATTA